MDKKEKKPCKKPVIRQTKTSIYRMAKANPLLIREDRIKVADKQVKLPLAVTFPGRLTLDDVEMKKWMQSRSVASTENMKNDESVTKTAKIPNKIETAPVSKTNSKPTTTVKQPIPGPSKPFQRKPLLKSKSEDNANIKQKAANTKSITNNKDNFKKPVAAAPKTSTRLRRSLSSEHFINQKKKTTPKCFGSINDSLNKSVSFQSLASESQKSGMQKFSKFLTHRSTSTPMHKQGSSMNLNLKDSALNRLQHPLKAWLKSRGKSLSNYHHLKCFGLQQLDEVSKEEQKENIPETCEKSDSYEDLRIAETQEASADNQKAFTDNLVAGALEDLHNIIAAGYAPEQCEAWLAFIQQKHKIEDKPQYWECRAGIEQRRGNITSAVECYKNSIINGANVDQIDESLGQLLSKFSLLNIETAKNPADVEKKRIAKEEEVRNIFKSTIIQFAIKERSLNVKEKEKEEKPFIGTPVRRSTRKSCAKFQHTPGKTMYDSWMSIDDSVKDNVEFRNNRYLV